jgi:restriction system protein
MCTAMDNRVHVFVWITMIAVPFFIFIKTGNGETAVIIFISEVGLYCTYALFWLRRMTKRQEDSEVWMIDKMTDEELKEFTIPLLAKLGYTISMPEREHPDISFLLGTPAGKKAIVKVKSHKRGVGIRLVQRTFKQMDAYDADECWVITNYGYTPQASVFARKHPIRLYEREQFIDWILAVRKGKRLRG